MRRTNIRHRARSREISVSGLVRETERMKAMREFVGIRRERSGCPDAVECVRNLRRDDRLDRLNER